MTSTSVAEFYTSYAFGSLLSRIYNPDASRILQWPVLLSYKQFNTMLPTSMESEESEAIRNSIGLAKSYFVVCVALLRRLGFAILNPKFGAVALLEPEPEGGYFWRRKLDEKGTPPDEYRAFMRLLESMVVTGFMRFSLQLFNLFAQEHFASKIHESQAHWRLSVTTLMHGLIAKKPRDDNALLDSLPEDECGPLPPRDAVEVLRPNGAMRTIPLCQHGLLANIESLGATVQRQWACSVREKSDCGFRKAYTA